MVSRYTLGTPREPAAPRLAERVVLVTGAAGGIGTAVSLACAREGATVIALDRNQRGLDRVYDAIVANGGPEPVQVREDLATLDAVRAQALAGQVENAFGRLDSLVWLAHEAAPLSPLEHFPEQAWQRIVHAGVNAPWILFRTLLPLLRLAEAPRVVLTAGDAGRRPLAYHGAVALAWSALDTLAGVMAEEFENRPAFRFFSVDPGAVHTPMRIGWYPGDDPGTLAEPDTIAEAYVYLASKDSAVFEGPLCRIADRVLECAR